ncbi:unnamed protein product [Rotaria socialis]|uniref:Uncharacterized protein n=1 Tax=Rotaria socialis TaxID=392032 RepID=A0A821LKH6_9BILA|nr:unnamed protein product [Rotaria socialis]CAF4751864.1 unnamed protein product [Rotaria socialis]
MANSTIFANWGSHLLEYRNGQVEFFEIQQHRISKLVWKANWASNWTHLLPFRWQHKKYLLSYKKSNGQTALNEVLNEGCSEGCSLEWRAGWEKMVIYYEGDQPRLLSTRAGEASVDILTGHSVINIAHT